MRIKYIDCMRGVTMFLVVYHHVAYNLGIMQQDSATVDFFLSFRMPVFFFISGFIAYKPISFFTSLHFYERIKNKAFVQLVLTAFFLSAI